MAARIGVIRVQMGAIHDRIGVIRARIGAIRNPIRARTALLAPLAAVLVLAVVAHPAAAQCERTPAGVKLLASDPSANAYLGAAVAISGNTIVVGAPGAITNFALPLPNGKAYFYVLSGGLWTEQARLSGPERSPHGSSFGSAVAILGNTAIIGEGDYSVAWFTNRSGTAWSAPTPLTRTEMTFEDQFGTSAAMGSLGIRTTAIVGARSYTGGGAAFVFSINTVAIGGWVESGFLTASDRAAGDVFGSSVAISGNTAVVGALNNTNAGGTNAGAVYVFTSNATAGGWTQQAKLVPTDPHAGDHFGTSVAISGDTILVGTPLFGNGNGKVYVFTRSGTVWTQRAALLPVDALTYFGQGVAISGDRIVVGAPYGTTPGHNFAGYALLFARPPGSGIAGTWAYEDLFVPADAANGDNDGAAVAISGTRLAVGSPRVLQGAVVQAGAAFAVDIVNPCPADFNCSGGLQVQDIFDFLAAWFALDPRANFNGVNGITAQDIFDFLAAWFAGC